jgi:hypothetical protein
MDFNAGRIIDDAVFYNKDAMTVAEIQAFLDAHTPDCDTWGVKPQTETSSAAYKGWSRADYARAMVAAGSTVYHAPPYICLQNYAENPNTGKTSFDMADASKPAGALTAAEIIYKAAQTYGINPQVLLVTLRKENGNRFRDDWPLISQYNYVMGYGCPDSGDNYSANCQAQYKGFYRQMMEAAAGFDRYKRLIGNYNYQPGRNNYIQYNPNPSCGGKTVYIENIATASLYIYTPYVPNAGALANYPGTANCGAYGNRNFFMYFNEWFGSTYGRAWAKMETPRNLIMNGSVVLFDTKSTTTSGGLCLRSAEDTMRGADNCVPYDELIEITTPQWIKFENLDTRYTKSNNAVKLVTSTGLTDEPLPKDLWIQFEEYAQIGNELCLRTKADVGLDKTTCILEKYLEKPPITFSPMKVPRSLETKSQTSKLNTFTLSPVEPLPKGLLISFESMTYVGGRLCLRTSIDTSLNKQTCIFYDDIQETMATFEPMAVARALTTAKNISKIDTSSGSLVEPLSGNLSIDFSERTTYNGALCLRTSEDARLGKPTCIVYSNLNEK